MIKKIKNLIVRLASVPSKNDDFTKREFILNILILGTIILAFTCTLSVQIRSLLEDIEKNHTASLVLLYATSLFFILLYILSKKGNAKIVSYIFIAVFLIYSFYISFRWGVHAPQGVLIFALVIVMAGILLGTKFSSLIVVFSSIFIFILFYLQDKKIISIDSFWMNQPIGWGDIFVYVSTIFVIYIVSWLSNREMEKSLKRARKSEAELKKERDSLEIKVMQRTEELRKTQYEKMRQLYRFAEFGRLSSGLFHDLTNYLTALSLNLEKAKTDTKNESKNVYGYLQRAFTVSNKIEDFIEAMQKQLQKQEVKKNFSVKKSISQIIQIFSYRIKKEKIKIFFECKSDFLLFGNPLKFTQVITNLLSNAIDSFLNTKESIEKNINVDLDAGGENIVISIKDNGCGIPEKNFQEIFKPFFTTKDPDHGTGIGLSTTKEIIENNFQGEIKISSRENQGTTAEIVIPKKWNE